MSGRDRAKTIEDLEFLDETRCGAFEAAERAGFASADALEKWLERHDAYDLWLSFKHRDAPGAHHKKERRMSAVPNTTDPIIAVLDAADESSRARTRKKAEKVRALLADLKSTLATEAAEDAAKAEARAEVERLEAELAEARARLRANAAAAANVSTAPKGHHPCPECDRVFDTPQGISLHRRKVHPEAATA